SFPVTMKFAILVLLSLSVATALKCYVGGSLGNNYDGVKVSVPCNEGEEYCYTSDVAFLGMHSVVRSCDPGDICQAEGCQKVEGVKTCCCKGDNCNA
ncbi:hypothetical protein PENTCL1PPCAC_12360, partial [Pristionchus entomophagus]